MINYKPNFFIVGAAKCATTSIYHYLSQHPDVFFPNIKEPKHFSAKYINFPHTGIGDVEFTDNHTYKDLEKYLELYEKAKKSKVIGDASVDNLYYYNTAIDIKKFNPDAKILIILRNPIDRAFSHYSHFIRDNRETETFKRALDLEEKRINMGYEFGWHYRKVGLYSTQVKSYIDTFGKDNIMILFFDDVEKDTRKILENICLFLKIDFSLIQNIELIKHNTSGKSKSRILNKLLFNHLGVKKLMKKFFSLQKLANIKALINSLNTEKDSVKDESIINQLKEYYKEDILELEKLLDKDLGKWK